MDLILSADKKAMRQSSVHGTRYGKLYAANKKNWEAAFSRDKNRCVFCGFQAEKHQEIHHLNQNHKDNSLSNLVTACVLCHSVFHLNNIGGSGGAIVWLPEMSQQELNHVIRTLAVMRHHLDSNRDNDTKDVDISKMVNHIEDSFKERALIMEQRVGTGSSDPVVMFSALVSMSKKDYDSRKDVLGAIRLFVPTNYIKVQAEYWYKETYNKVPVKEWIKLVRG